jgi:hypothetical protein
MPDMVTFDISMYHQQLLLPLLYVGIIVGGAITLTLFSVNKYDERLCGATLNVPFKISIVLPLPPSSYA